MVESSSVSFWGCSGAPSSGAIELLAWEALIPKSLGDPLDVGEALISRSLDPCVGCDWYLADPLSTLTSKGGGVAVTSGSPLAYSSLTQGATLCAVTACGLAKVARTYGAGWRGRVEARFQGLKLTDLGGSPPSVPSVYQVGTVLPCMRGT